jgi:hypothetical protein
LAAYQLDNAVLFMGAVIEAALADYEKIGDESRQKYTIDQLLDPDFRLSPARERYGGIREMAVANPDLVGRWKQRPKAA